MTGRRAGGPRGPVLAVAALAVVLAGCSGTPSPAGTTSPTPGVTGRPVHLPRSEVRMLESSAAGRTYELHIAYPEDYVPGSGTTYPVVYFPDAQWDFPVLRAVHDNQVYDGTVPKTILVGITYPGEAPDYGALRAHDLTPVVDRTVRGSGGAADFLTFVTTELVPYVESRLGGDPRRRYLVGSSFGGLFALYAMYRDPGFFAGYLASSPAVTFGSGEIPHLDALHATARKPLRTRLYVTVGTEEQLHVPVARYVDGLRRRGYEGLRLGSRELDGEGHAGGKTEAYSHGLRFLFSAS